MNINLDTGDGRECLSAENCTGIGFVYFSLFLLIDQML